MQDGPARSVQTLKGVSQGDNKFCEGCIDRAGLKLHLKLANYCQTALHLLNVGLFVATEQGEDEVLMPADVTELPDLCVLVVDDHPGVLNMLEMALQYYGLVVLVADCGEAAVEVFREHSHSISVVLLDVQMRGLDGPQTLVALQQINPQVRCCFMSASVGRYSSEQLLSIGAAHVFEKPFSSLAELAEALRTVVLAGQ